MGRSGPFIPIDHAVPINIDLIKCILVDGGPRAGLGSAMWGHRLSLEKLVPALRFGLPLVARIAHHPTISGLGADARVRASSTVGKMVQRGEKQKWAGQGRCGGADLRAELLRGPLLSL